MEALQLELQLNEERRQIAEEREAREKEAEQRKRNKDKQQVLALMHVSQLDDSDKYSSEKEFIINTSRVFLHLFKCDHFPFF